MHPIIKKQAIANLEINNAQYLAKIYQNYITYRVDVNYDYQNSSKNLIIECVLALLLIFILQIALF
jgi:hypothetical protein